MTTTVWNGLSVGFGFTVRFDQNPCTATGPVGLTGRQHVFRGLPVREPNRHPG